MNTITGFFSQAFVEALGWALLHSLWQGALSALVLGLLLLLLHRHKATTRYAVSGAALLVQLLVFVGTFCYYFYTAPLASTTVTAAANWPQTALAAGAASTDTFWFSPLLTAKTYFAQHLPLLVSLWLLGLVLMTLRLLGGLALTQRLRHYKALPLGAKWEQQLNTLRQALGMSTPVQLLESALVRVPITIGLAKPVILLPVGAVTGLAPAQVEAILAHELAHILRKDYLVNLLQSVVETFFFYHPAVWWMSAAIRAEREHCCDDMAVAVCGDTLTYARALTELEAMRLPATPSLALAFSGSSGSLLNRIKRLVGQPASRPTFSEGFAAALVMVIGLSVLSFGAMAGWKPIRAESLAPPIIDLSKPAVADNSTVEAEEKGAFVYTIQDTSGRKQDVVIIKNKKGKVSELYVDGKRIPQKDIPAYTELVNQRLQATQKAPKASRAEVRKKMQQARAAVAATRRSNRETYRYHFRYSGDDSLAMAPVPPVPPVPGAPLVPPPPLPPLPPVAPPAADKEAMRQYRQEQKRFEQEMRKFREEMKKHEKAVEKRREQGALDNRLHRQQVARHQEMAQRHAARSREMAQRHQAMAQRHREGAAAHRQHMQQLQEELVKDGVIEKEAANLSIQLNNEGLFVNGKKLPQELEKKYKKLLDVETDGKASLHMQYKSE